MNSMAHKPCYLYFLCFTFSFDQLVHVLRLDPPPVIMIPALSLSSNPESCIWFHTLAAISSALASMILLSVCNSKLRLPSSVWHSTGSSSSSKSIPKLLLWFLGIFLFYLQSCNVSCNSVASQWKYGKESQDVIFVDRDGRCVGAEVD